MEVIIEMAATIKNEPLAPVPLPPTKSKVKNKHKNITTAQAMLYCK